MALGRPVGLVVGLGHRLGLGWPWGWGWGGGGVYVINEGAPVANQYARIDTDVSPEAAEVYLDGTLIGQADDFDGFPDYLYLEAGKYRLEFRHPSYEPIVKEIEVRAGQAVALNDEMKLLPGIKKLQVVDPEDKGTPLGRVFGKPGTKANEAEGDKTGRYDVQGGPGSGIDGEPIEVDFDGPDEDVRPPCRRRRPRTPRRGALRNRPGETSLRSAQGRLRFEVEPDDAAVYVDDRYVGTAEELGDLSRGLRLKPGKTRRDGGPPGVRNEDGDGRVEAGSGHRRRHRAGKVVPARDGTGRGASLSTRPALSS